MDLDEQRWEFLARVETFARERVAPSAQERDRAGLFDRGLWRELGEIGFHRALLPADAGGLGLDISAIADALGILAREGRDLSLCVSLTPALALTHLQIARLGTEDQKQRFLPPLLSGEWVPAVAFSELPHGANPKHLRTRATRKNDTWTIDGAKAFVTNGPDADVYMVLAVTGEGGDRKGFSAFLVEKETEGLVVEERMPIEFVRAAPHAIISLHNCKVPERNRLGRLNDAIDQISRVIREAEDTVGASSLAGHMALIIDLTASHLGSRVREDADTAEAIGELRIEAEGARLRANALAQLWNADAAEKDSRGSAATSPAREAFLATLLGAREGAERFSGHLTRLLEETPPMPESDLARAARDLAMARIGSAGARKRLRRLGEQVAAKGGSP